MSGQKLRRCKADGCNVRQRSTSGHCKRHRDQIPVSVDEGLIHLAGWTLTPLEAIRLSDNIIDAVEEIR